MSWLIGFLFCLSLSLGCLALLMLQHLSGGQWGMVGRRVFEAGSRMLPIVALLVRAAALRHADRSSCGRSRTRSPADHDPADEGAVPERLVLRRPRGRLLPVLDAAGACCSTRWSAAAGHTARASPSRLDSLSQGQRPGPAVPRHHRDVRLGRLGHVARARMVLDHLRPADDRRLRPDGARVHHRRAGRHRPRSTRRLAADAARISTTSASCCSRS